MPTCCTTSASICGTSTPSATAAKAPPFFGRVVRGDTAEGICVRRIAMAPTEQAAFPGGKMQDIESFFPLGSNVFESQRCKRGPGEARAMLVLSNHFEPNESDRIRRTGPAQCGLPVPKL